MNTSFSTFCSLVMQSKFPKFFLMIAAFSLLLASLQAQPYRRQPPLPKRPVVLAYKFDFGAENSPVREGFTKITDKTGYDRNKGYGWLKPNGLKAQFKEYSSEFEKNENSGHNEPGPIYTNALTCDSVYSKEENTFIVDVKSGSYYAYFWSGQSDGSRYEYHQFQIKVGSRKISIKFPGPHTFHKKIFRVSARGRGQLRIQFSPRTDWIATGLVLFETKKEKKVRSEFLDALEKEIEFLPPDVASKWKETKHIDARPIPEPTSTDEKRGFMLFSQHYTEVVYSNTVPRKQELNPELKLFATQGEYEPATVTILPLKDIKAVRVGVSDLKNGGAKIPASAIDVRFVRYALARPNYSLFNSYHEVPDALMSQKSVDLKKGINQRLWLTVHVSEDAKPGMYQGKVTILNKAEKTEVKLIVRVLPIKLKANPELQFGTYYYDPLRYVRESNTKTANAYFEKKGELERKDMVAHGMTMHISAIRGIEREGEGEDAKWTIDPQATERIWEYDRKAGLMPKELVVQFPLTYWYRKLVDEKGQGSHLRLVNKDVPESFYEEITKLIELIEKTGKERDWPKLIYYPIDEPGTSENAIAYLTNIMKAIKKVEGVKTYVTANPTKEAYKPIWEYTDIFATQTFVYSREELNKIQKEKNVEIWSYPNHVAGENDHTPIRGARMTFGFGRWRSGVKVLVPWIYAHSTGDPWNYLDGDTMDFMNRSTVEGEPIPVVLWEAYREGIDDSKYIYTLEQLIAKGIAKGGRSKTAAEKAQKELDFIEAAIKVQSRYKYDDLWRGKDFDGYRWMIASQILELQNLK